MSVVLPCFRALLLTFSFSIALSLTAKAYTVTELQATRYNGQVFLTWKNPAQTNLQYNVYRSTSPFVSVANLNTSTFLGYVRDNSAKNVRKTSLYGGSHYFKITATAPPLASDRGLYVATCTNNASYYYAVTVVTLSNGQEDKSVLNAGNSLVTPIAEIVADPQPVLQVQATETDGTLRYEYAQWGNNQNASHYPAFTNSGSYAWNFTVFKQGNSTNKSIYVLFRDDDPFSNSGLTICTDCSVLKIDDRLPNGIDTYWSGWNENYNMYATNNPVATTGVVKMYTQVRLKEMLEWVKTNISADGNKVYTTGISHNAFGALLCAEMWPDLITAVFAKNVPILIKAMNNSEREQQWCDNVLNLSTDYIDPNNGLPIAIWDIMDIRHMYWVNEKRDGPFATGINGKQDVTVGWVQKYFWYDTVNASRQGGAWYWDQRSHNNDGAKFLDEEVTVDYERFTLARSYPAFSYCSINQNPGNGTPFNGDAIGALNGYLDWNDASIIDNASNYAITCFVKNMYAGGVLMANQYDSCTTDLTFRRLQQFHPNIGQTISWKVKNSNNKTVQQGSILYAGGPITLNGIKIYRSNSYITLSIGGCSTLYYTDNDQDGYGSSSDPGTTYCTPPSGVVTNNSDCNDANAAIKPGAQEICDANDVDQDCDGLADDADPSATGKITYYPDNDHDGFGSSAAPGTAYCNPPAWTTTNHTDCNDANAAIKPGGQEICDAGDVDEDCDGLADDADASSSGKITYYVDSDHDGFGSATASGVAYCNPPAWTTTNHTDCNDANAAIKPGANELCNLIDDDCDVLIDENAGSSFYLDADNDGYGNLNFPVLACVAPVGYVTLSTDCNDGNANVHPGATDMCDGVDNNCNSVVDENAITVSINPAGSVSGCKNDLVTLTASGTNIGSYQWYKGSASVAGQTNFNYSLDYENTTVKVVASNSFGCTANSNVTTITALNNPTAVITPLNGGNLDLCQGAVNLSASGTTTYSWQWYRNGILLSGATNKDYAATNTGNYEVQVTNISTGCNKTSAAVTVTGPSTIFYADADQDGYGSSADPGTPYCNPPSNVVTNNSDCNDGNPNVHPDATDMCDGLDNNCNSVVDENAITVSINPAGSVSGCKNDLVTLTASGTNIGSYQWYKGSASVAGQTNFNYSLDYENTTVKVVASNSFGCTANSNVTTITALNNPTAVITPLNGGNLDLCQGAVNLSASGTTTYSWQWYRNGILLSGATNKDYAATNTGNYEVQVTNISTGCNKTSAAVTVTGPSTIFYADADQDGYGSSADPGTPYCNPPSNVVTNNSDCNDGNPNVHPDATDMCDGLDNNCNSVVDENAITVSINPAGSVSGCKNDLVTLTASGTNIGSYQWYKGSASVAGQTNFNYSLDYENTTVKVVASNSFGCTANSNVTTITALNNPTAVITPLNGGNLDLCQGAVNLSASGTTTYSWQWYRNGILLSGATSKDYAATNTGNYEVQVTNISTGCNKTSAPITVISSCKELTEKENDIIELKVYPNPSNGLFHIAINNIKEVSVMVRLYDITGRLLLTRDDGVQYAGYHTNLDLSCNPSGMYMVEMIIDDQLIHREIINQ